ncbi:hypothetical protein Tco_0398530 [Tanacetum coccineum]
MWRQVPIVYDKHALWGISHRGRKRQQFYGYAVNRESAHDVYSRNRIIAIKKLTIVEWHNYKHLKWITVRRDDNKLYIFKEGDYNRLRLQDIEDMLLLLVRGKLKNLNIEERLALGNQDKKNRLQCIDELYKFSDGTLNDVRSALDDTLNKIRMKYLPQTIWREEQKDNEEPGKVLWWETVRGRPMAVGKDHMIYHMLFSFLREHAEYDESNTYVLERFNTTAGNLVKEILLKLNLPDHSLILTDLKYDILPCSWLFDLDSSKDMVFMLEEWLEKGGIRGEIGVDTFRNVIRANYSNEYVASPSLTLVRPWFSSIGYNGEIGATGTLKKSSLPLRFISLFLEYMMPEYDHEDLTINPTQVFSDHNWKLKANQHEGPPFTGHVKAICNIDVHVESQALTTSSKTEMKVPKAKTLELEVDSEKNNLQNTHLRCNASADSTAESDPGISAPNDFIPKQQDIQICWSSVLKGSRRTKAQRAYGALRSDEISKKIKLEDLLNLMQDTRSAFLTPDSPQDEPIITDKLEQQKAKAKAEVAFLKARPPYPDINQLTKLLVTSLKLELSKLISSHDFANCLPTELKELPSKITELSRDVKELKKHVAELKTLQWELPSEFLGLPSQISSVQEKIKTLDALPSLLHKDIDTLNRFSTNTENASSKAIDMGVPSAGHADASPAEGEKNINQATKDSKGKEVMSPEDAENEETESDSENDHANPAKTTNESSKQKKLKKFNYVTEGGEQIHLTVEKIEEQKRIEESLKAELAKQKVEKKKSSKIINRDVLTTKGPITLKVYREDGTNEVISNLKVNDLHLAEWGEEEIVGLESLKKVQLQFFRYLEDKDHLHFSLCGGSKTKDKTLARASVQPG